jgi:hypothetical protein
MRMLAVKFNGVAPDQGGVAALEGVGFSLSRAGREWASGPAHLSVAVHGHPVTAWKFGGMEKCFGRRWM